MSACFEGDDRRTTCPSCNRQVWLEDGCTCEQPPSSHDRHDVRDLSSRARRAPSSPDLICGMPRAAAENLLERCINAWGLMGLLVSVKAWEDEHDAA